jgi:hypothetical protein
MSLIHELDGAELVVTDEDLELLFVWYGGATVNVLNLEGEVLDTFSISEGFERKLTAREVKQTIFAWRAEMFGEDES